MLNTHFFKSVHFAAPKAGTRLVVTGAVHGNETCGTHAIQRVMAEIEHGELVLQQGSVTFVPVTNPLAFHKKQRNGDRNLNRNLVPNDQPRDFEDHIANWLCPLLAQHEVLLDLHSFAATGQPFVMLGPQNNAGTLEPFQAADKEVALALHLGVSRFVDGWLDTYARGVQKRRARMEGTMSRVQALDADPRYGVGTTEFMRSVGGYALTLECGNHADPNAVDVAYRAIRNTLAHCGHTEPLPATPRPDIEMLSIHAVVDKLNVNDTFERSWSSFDYLHTGDLIGTRHDRTPVRAEGDGYILFPNAGAASGQEWFYLAKASQRLAGAH